MERSSVDSSPALGSRLATQYVSVEMRTYITDIYTHRLSQRHFLLFRCHSAWKLSCVAAPKRRAALLPSNLEASGIPWRSRWISPVPATVRQRPKPTAPSVATATGPMSVACVSVTRVVWAHDVSVQWRTTVHLMMPTASRRQGTQSAAGEATVCADSAPAMQMSLARCGANTANVTTSTACASKGHCAPVSRYNSFCHYQC